MFAIVVASTTSPVLSSATDTSRVAHALESPRNSQRRTQSTFDTHVHESPRPRIRTSDAVGSTVGALVGQYVGEDVGVSVGRDVGRGVGCGVGRGEGT